MKNSEDIKFLKLIQSNIYDATFALITILQMGERPLLNFIKRNGNAEVRNSSHKDSDFKVNKVIRRPLHRSAINKENDRYIKYKDRKGIISYIYCGHCVSIFTHNPAEDIQVIDLTEEVVWI